MQIVLADLASADGFVSKDTVAGGTDRGSGRFHGSRGSYPRSSAIFTRFQAFNSATSRRCVPQPDTTSSTRKERSPTLMSRSC